MLRKSMLVLLVFLILAVSVSALEFNGTVYDLNGTALSDVTVNLSNYTLGASGPTLDSSVNVTTNGSGWFNVSMDDNSAAMYKPIIFHTNTTFNFVDYVGRALPSLPYTEFSGLTEVNFYLKEAGTINITAINSSGDIISFGYIVKDTKLGYEVSMNTNVSNVGELVYLPRDRNYSIMIWPVSGTGQNFVPVSYEWNNFSQTVDEDIGAISSYNGTTRTLHKQFNVTESYARITGYVNGSDYDVEQWSNLTVVPFVLEPSGMIFTSQGTLPYNASAWNGSQSDFYNTTSGLYNITLPYASEETVKYILYASGYNGTTYLGSYRNITVTSDLDEFNFTMYGLLGETANVSQSDSAGGANWLVWTKKLALNLINSTGIHSSVTAHTETTVDYSSYSCMEFTFMEDISTAVGTFRIPLLNVTGIKEINIYSNSFAPKRVSEKSVSQLTDTNVTNITLLPFRPGGGGIPGQDIILGSLITMSLYHSNTSCDIPNPPSKCNFADSTNLNDFTPLKYIVGGGDVSFRMGTGGVLVHYVKTDMLASGPPDALFEENTGVTSSSFDSALKFGSSGPSTYDYVLISMPYSESAGSGLDDSKQVNLSIPVLYDDDWNVIWNASLNGTNGSELAANFSHYNAHQNEWEALLGNSTCISGTLNASTELNISNPCYINTSSNRIWIRLPHFSGTSPSISGSTTAAAASSSSSSSGGGSVISAADTVEEVKEVKEPEVKKEVKKVEKPEPPKTEEKITAAAVTEKVAPEKPAPSKEAKKKSLAGMAFAQLGEILTDLTWLWIAIVVIAILAGLGVYFYRKNMKK